MTASPTPAALDQARAYLAQHFGKPWSLRGEPPLSFDCGSYWAHTQLTLFGRTVEVGNADPARLLQVVRTIAAHPLRAMWEKTTTPRHGDTVELSCGSEPHHVGTYLALDRGILAHCVRGAGVRNDAWSQLPALGWHRITCWSPA